MLYRNRENTLGKNEYYIKLLHATEHCAVYTLYTVMSHVSSLDSNFKNDYLNNYLTLSKPTPKLTSKTLAQCHVQPIIMKQTGNFRIRIDSNFHSVFQCYRSDTSEDADQRVPRSTTMAGVQKITFLQCTQAKIIFFNPPPNFREIR